MSPDPPPAEGRRFPPSARLLSKSDFDRVFQQGRRRGGPLLVLAFLPRREGPSRLGLAVSRKVGKAVDRNRVRRRLREIFRLHRAAFARPFDIVAMARPEAADASYQALEQEFLSLLRWAENTRWAVIPPE